MKKRISLVLYVALIFLFLRCAKRGNPSGGPIDETAPVLLRATPELSKTKFKDDRIRLYFDEYVKLNKLNEQLIISPPIDATSYSITPQSTAAKYIEIKFLDSLKPNTTYNFNFGQSIVDNNEGNPFSYFRYVFSTGEYVDSLKVSGTIGNAFGREPRNFVSVMLYSIDSTYTDSIIFKRPPDYLSNTLDSLKVFEIENVRSGQYLVIAQKDIANNYTFDQRSDEIGFVSDFINLPLDSLFHMDLFLEQPDFSLGRTFQAGKNRVGIGYFGDPSSLKIKPLNINDSIQTVQSFDKTTDTIYFWYNDLKLDSLMFNIQHDKLNTEITHQIRKSKIDSLNISFNFSGTLHLNDTLRIESSTPITNINKDLINFINRDSIPVPFNTYIEDPHNIRFDFEILPNDTYKMKLLPGAITDFFEEFNDTLEVQLRTKKPSDYGSVTLQLLGVPSYPIILQLTDEKEKLVRSLNIKAAQPKISLTNLLPKKYYVRLIVDENQNGKWDTGRFLDRRLPEKVYHYEPLLDVRANWELQERFILK